MLAPNKAESQRRHKDTKKGMDMKDMKMPSSQHQEKSHE